jgi:DNA repair photolyase
MASDWGGIIEVKTNIVEVLKKELAKRTSGVYGVGTVTDPYQPLEKEYELTRGCLRMLRRSNARVSILTKSSLVLRDLDILRDWKGLEVGISIGCPDDHHASELEPGASPPSERFEAMSSLSKNGIDVYLMAAPIIPGVGDSEKSLVQLIASAADSGARRVIWDKYNPKPMAGARMKRTMAALGMKWPPEAHSGTGSVGSILIRECRAKGLELEDAF